MSTSKLPARPSLESLRKQAKKLARDVAAGDVSAIARARAQLPNAKLPLSHRDAQLVLARENGFSGWKDLAKEVKKRLGQGLEWPVTEARRIIHDNDIEGLRQKMPIQTGAAAEAIAAVCRRLMNGVGHAAYYDETRHLHDLTRAGGLRRSEADGLVR